MYNDDYVTVKISKTSLLDAFMNRLYEFAHLESDDYEYNAFENYYQNLIDEGAFDGAELDINAIVDNDWVNNIIVTDEGSYKQYVEENDLVDNEDMNNINSFETFKEYMKEEGRYAAESDNGEVVLIYA